LTPLPFQRKIAFVPATFSEAFARVRQLVADFRANEKFYLSPAYQEFPRRLQAGRVKYLSHDEV
jgi:hypothetical protein